MFSDFLDNTVAGEGLLNLFVGLFILTFVSALLLFVSRKWISSTRSFLLIGVIFSYLIIIGLNLAFFEEPNNRFSLVSITLPAIDSEQQQAIFSTNRSLEYIPGNRTVPSNSNKTVSWARLILSVTMIAGVVWLCGTVIYIIKLAVDLVSVYRFQRKLVLVEDIRKQQLLQKVKTRLIFKDTPKLYSSTHIESPMTIGLFRPVIVIPDKLLNVMSREECLCVLSHESGHVKHRDNLTGLFQRIFIALNWWNPLAYIISARYTLTREDTCDQYAVTMIDNSVRYTTCLVNLAEKSCLISSFKPAMGMIGCERSLAKRLTRILSKEKTVNTKLTLTKKILLMGFCGAIILCCASIQTAFAQDDSKDDPRMERYKAIEARITEAVKAGKISKEDAEKRLVAARKEIFGDKKRGERKFTREDYRRAAEEMRKMVADGSITKEDMEKRLGEMRRMIGEGESRDSKEMDGDGIKKRIEIAKKRIEDAVNSGKMTREEADKMLEGLKKRMEMVGDKKVDEDAKKKRLEGAKKRMKRIEEAVRSGKMTREEADKMLEGLKKRMKKAGDGDARRERIK